jgi:homoserine dehydrogenase
MNEIRVGLIGFGTVGSGLVRVLSENQDPIRRKLGIPVRLTRIADLDITTDRGVPVDRSILTTDAKSILTDPGIDVVVELIGGDEPAKSFLLEAIRNKKHVVTANKALLAKSGEEIFAEAEKQGVGVGFEASVGGAIPIIRSLREGMAANRIRSIYGIVNGTSNYILSRMTHEGSPFETVLKEAQKQGYAEADPTFDVEGIDSAHKIAILAMLAFGTPVDFNQVYTEGIRKVTPIDILYAGEFGYRIKLLAVAKNSDGQIEIRVHPTMVNEENPIAKVEGTLNAIEVIGDLAGEGMLIGRGAGSLPTASAVAADLIEIGRNMRTGGGKRLSPFSFLPNERKPIPIRPMDDLSCRYYLRFTVLDKPGVLSQISGILGNHSISIESVIQKGRQENEPVPVVIMTHVTQERNLKEAIRKVDRLETVTDKTVIIRVDD